MKKITISILLSVITLTVMAQQKIRTTNYAIFQNWAKQINISGYKPGGVENEDDNSYVAMFMSGTNRFIQLRVGDISQFKNSTPAALKPQNYTFEGKNASYLYYAETSMLAVAYTDMELCVMVSSTGKVEKAILESILKQSNPAKLKALTSLNAEKSSINWPAKIPAVLKLHDAKSIRKNDPDGYYSEIYEVKVPFSNSLITQLEGLMKKYACTTLSESIVEGNTQLICSSGETVEQLKEQFKTGEEVSFMYYIK